MSKLGFLVALCSFPSREECSKLVSNTCDIVGVCLLSRRSGVSRGMLGMLLLFARDCSLWKVILLLLIAKDLSSALWRGILPLLISWDYSRDSSICIFFIFPADFNRSLDGLSCSSCYGCNGFYNSSACPSNLFNLPRNKVAGSSTCPGLGLLKRRIWICYGRAEERFGAPFTTTWLSEPTMFKLMF